MPGEKDAQKEKKTTCAPEAPCAKVADEIRAEAYAKYLWRCESHEPGSEFDDWVSAEKSVQARHSAKPTPSQTQSSK